MFDTTQLSSVLSFIANNTRVIREKFGIDWSTVRWEELTKPLHSAIGARLYLQYVSRNKAGGIPRAIDEQGQFWATFYMPSTGPGKNAVDFVTLATTLEKGTVA